jgi:hypothetical protein
MSDRTRRIPASACWFLLLTLVAAGQISAVEVPEWTGVGEKEFRHSDLDFGTAFKVPAELPEQAALRAAADLAALGVPAERGRLDIRSGRWASITPARPLVPGKGVGNGLTWEDLGRPAPASDAELRGAAGQAFRGYLQNNSTPLRIDVGELAGPGHVSAHREGTVVQIHVPRVFNGLPVRGSYLSAVINHGNLVLFGSNNWGDIQVSTEPGIFADEALVVVQAHVEPFTITGAWGKRELMVVPMARDDDVKRIPVGQGYNHRLAWVIRPSFEADLGRYEALVDAHSGQLLSFEDTNRYAEVKGGVYPVSNDGIAPDGVEQPGWPMPFDNISTTAGTVTSDSGGNFTAASGSRTSNLSGQYVRINDNCGAISLTTTGDIDFGTSGGDDCVTPGFGGAGNTHASRTGFHELNRIIEMGRSHLPSNSWLQQQLTSNMNINLTCNAFWGGGTVNFYRSGGGCFNTGEIAGVFDHEWGHGLDDNDAVPTIASPSGEGIADIYTALRLNTSCIGRNFRSTNCTGFGDPCLDCTGVRDIDYLKHASGQPHDYTWRNANCGSSVHCIGHVYSEAVWSLWKRKLQQAPYNYDNNTAHEIVNRLTFIGAGNTGTWFSGGPPNGGCSGSSGYMNYLAADDDNGDLNDGTPHMGAIFSAFNDQEIACQTPTVQDSGCAGTPTTAPVVTGTPFDKSASLSWGAVTGAASYEVFRTDGVFACDFGKIRLGETTGTSFSDSGLQNGRAYSYVVIPKGPSAACFGPASSCTTVTPAAGPNLAVDANSAVLAILGGDGDQFLDNCEDGTLTFDVHNTGLGGLTNVRIVSVTPTSHPATTVTTTFPAAVSPPSIGQGGTGSGSFDFTAGGLAPGDTLIFQVEVTADELTASKFENLSVSPTESDFTTFASKTFSFETDLEEWSVEQGTFNRSTALGGGGGTSWAIESSSGLHDQCDRIRSPLMRLQATSTLSLETNYDIEPLSSGTWYDRANVGVIDSGNARTAVNPDGGRLYNADSSGPGNYSGCNDPEPGWAGAAATWAGSSWSATALQSGTFAGQDVRLEVIYATDPALANRGFSFDQVTMTDVDFQVDDTQSDVCSAGCTIDDDCDDGLHCNGAETCIAGTCQPGTPPACDDGVGCTDDSCNESTNSCDNVANDTSCDDGQFCNGAETCDAVLDCQAVTAPDCSDSVSCTDDSCDAAAASGTGACVSTPNDANCDDGLFCNGAETCDALLDCQAGGDPCPGQGCDDVNDVCVGVCDNNGICEINEICGTCPNDCISGTTPGAGCGNGLCEAGDGEDCLSCPQDCNGKQNGRPSNRFCCGDGDGQNPVDCSDSRCTDGGFQCTDVPQSGESYCCGDLTCEGAEDSFNCEIDCGAPPMCGNNTTETGEVCDGTDLGGQTCGDLGCSGGSLACLNDCSDFETSGCTDCCVPTHSKEKGPRCSDGLDNDCDGLTDGADPDC